jgi:hypothetical protein
MLQIQSEEYAVCLKSHIMTNFFLAGNDGNDVSREGKREGV